MSRLWESLGLREVFRAGERLRVFMDHVRLPDGREVPDYMQFRLPDFAVMVALTPDNDVICERQYKHGAGREILTLPSGALEPGEDPLAAARRELLEETGYAGQDWQALPRRVMHANAGGGTAHPFLVRGCRKVAQPRSGDLEDMSIELHPIARLLSAAMADEMPLAGDMTALFPALVALGALTGRDQ